MSLRKYFGQPVHYALVFAFLFLLNLFCISIIQANNQDPNDHFRISSKISSEISIGSGYNDPSERFIVQFTSEPSRTELDNIRGLGYEIERTFHAVPALSVNGPFNGLDALSNIENVVFIERNDPVTTDMEKSTDVINATQVWASVVKTSEGIESPIDGSGVTVCVVDTGIDAGHPDLDYTTKTILNVYDAGNGLWLEGENTDTNYGHGTHVAGTVAGNGDASAGSRRGVAPGANLIGITVSIPEEVTSPYEDGYIQGLEWVYDHSRPGANPHNIRVVTNSWHSTVTEYDPQSLLTQMIEKLSFENNVVSTWSAGNDGRDDPEGQELTTSGQGNTPVAIMVGAYERDGSAVTDFSSRGKVGANHTYPDVGAPGRSIWSASARRTIISGASYVGGNRNPYYLAISGTSMSTPHVAGLVALLWQACPDMGISHLHEDYSGDDPEGWYSNPLTRIHESEWILEASAKFLPPTEEHGNVGGDTNSTGWWGKPVDYVQGYGIVDAKRAVGIALTLHRLRERYPDSNISVGDAIRSYDNYNISSMTLSNTTKAHASWSGEYSRYNDQSGNPLSLVNQTKFVVVPKGAEEAEIILEYANIDVEEFKAGDLAFTVDTNGDGNPEHQSDLSFFGGGVDRMDLSVEGGGMLIFDIIGMGIRIPRPLQELSYVELRVEYELSVVFTLSEGGYHDELPRSAIYEEPTPSTERGGSYLMESLCYDTTRAELVPGESIRIPESSEFPWWMLMAAVITFIALIIFLYSRKGKKDKSG